MLLELWAGSAAPSPTCPETSGQIDPAPQQQRFHRAPGSHNLFHGGLSKNRKTPTWAQIYKRLRPLNAPGPERWTPSFGQLRGRFKVDSGFVDSLYPGRSTGVGAVGAVESAKRFPRSESRRVAPGLGSAASSELTCRP